jgi:hypothetical protein
MKVISGTFNGTGAIVKIACGFLPDFVKVVNITSATLESIEWNRGMLKGAAAVRGGIKRSGDVAVADAKLAVAAGIQPNTGGNTAAKNQTVDLVYTPANPDFSFVAAGEKTVVPAGFELAADADVNVVNEVCYFEAGFFD